MFLRSCKSILKFNAAVKWSGSKLLRHLTFQRGLLEQTTACLLQGTTELHPVARRNGLHGCGDASVHLDGLQGHSGCWQATCQPRSRSRCSRRTLQPWHAAELLTSPRFATEVTSSAASCYAVKNFIRFACSSSLVPQRCHFPAQLRLWGDAVGTRSSYATLHFAYGCGSRSCCAKRFPSNHPDSCLPVMVMAVSFPVRKCPAAGSTVSAASPWGARVGHCIYALHFGLCCKSRARARECGSPPKSALRGSGHLCTGGRKASFAGTIPPFAWEGFNVQRAALRAPTAKAEEAQLVLPPLSGGSESGTAAQERSSHLPTAS